MERSEFEDAIQWFKGREAAEDIIPVISNEDIQRLVVAWPKIVIKPGSGAGRPPEDPNER